MRYVQEFRNAQLVRNTLNELRRIVTRPWVLMEICGGQTHAILQYGLDQLLPPEIELIHGPGCPVCVTPLEQIDRALEIARQPNVIFCSFGDMLRVPGSQHDLFSIRAAGAQVRTVYSPLDAIAGDDAVTIDPSYDRRLHGQQRIAYPTGACVTSIADSAVQYSWMVLSQPARYVSRCA